MGPGPVIGRTVSFRCLKCGQVSRRPPAYLRSRYGATSLAEVARRARCLRYIRGVRCNGPASVGWECLYGPSQPSG